MNKNRLFWLITALTVVLTAAVIGLLLRQPEGQTVTVYDSRGAVIASGTDEAGLLQGSSWAYVDVALAETAQVLAEQYGCTAEEALERLFRDGMNIYTAFDPTVFAATEAALAQQTYDVACAVTDLGGSLVAVYSSGTVNYASCKTAPYSSFKPLSVYAPALDSGAIMANTAYEDSPYSRLSSDDGTLTDWPSNATGTYSGRRVYIGQAIAQSLNTVAVKCMADYGVGRSLAFLQQKLGIPLTQEEQAATLLGEEEILGSLALGYLEEGVSPIDMAGYYQMFANGGMYLAPKALVRLCDANGETVYESTREEARVLSAGTADLMNRLLRGVVTAGTGTAAQCTDVQTAGKTGTGDGHAGNWFVGITPGYSCAVWHGQAQENNAAQHFSEVMQEVYDAQPDANRSFITHSNLYPIAFCTQSGHAASNGCTQIELGYFPSQDALPICQEHAQHD